jgi:hypothetical protein
MDLASYHLPGASDFEIVRRFLETLWTSGVWEWRRFA